MTSNKSDDNQGIAGLRQASSEPEKASSALPEPAKLAAFGAALAGVNSRIVADNPHEFEFWLDPEGRVLYVSPSVEAITGYSPEEFISSAELRQKLIHPEDLHILLEHRKAEIGQRADEEVEYRIIRRGGDVRWVAHACQPVFNAQGAFLGTRGSTRDVTRRKEAEAKLNTTLEELTAANEELEVSAEELRQQNDELARAHEETRRLASFPELNPNPIVEIALDGKVTYQNAAAQKAFPDLARTQRQHPALAGLEDTIAAMTGGRTIEVSRTVPVRERHYLQWLYYVADLKRVRIYMRDVTERVKAEQDLSQTHEELEVNAEELALENEELRTTEESLRATSDYLENLLNYANAPIIVWDAHLRITRFNHAFERLTGRKAQDVLGHDIDLLFPDDRRRESLDQIRRTATGERWETVEIAIQHVDGSVRTVLWNSATLFAPDGRTAVSTIAQGQDITERKRIEQALRESEQKFRTVADNTYDFEFWLGPDGKYLYVSPSCERVTGRKPEEFFADPGLRLQIAHPDDRARLSKHCEDAERSLPGELEFRIVRPDGEVRWISHVCQPVFDAAGKFLGTRGSNRDLTERKQVEMKLAESREELEVTAEELRQQNDELTSAHEELRKKEATLNGILDATQESIWLFSPSGIVLTANEVALRRFDRPAGEIIGRHMSEILQPDLARSRMTRLNEVVASGEPVEFEDIRSDIAFRHSFYPVKDSGGRVTGVVSFSRDITERKRAETERNRLADEVRAEKEKLSALVASIRDEIWFADTQKRFTLTNPAALRDFALASGQVVDIEKFAAGLEVLRPDGSPRPVEDAPPLRALKGEVITEQEEMVRTPASGELRYRAVSAAPVRDHEGTIIGSVSVVRDITERKQAEEQVRRSQKTFSELIERAPFGIYVVDSQFRIAQMNTGSQNGAFVNVRPVIGREFGEAMRILWPETVAAEIVAHFRHTLETGEPYYSPSFVNPRHDVEVVEAYEWELHRITLPDGQQGVICYYFDSTKLRQAELSLRASEEGLRRAQEIAHLGSWDLDLVKNILTWSDEVYRIFGLKPQEFGATYEAFLSYVHPDDRAAVDAAYSGSVREGRNTYEIEHRVVRKTTGEVRVVQERCRHERDGQGKVIRSVGMVLDITERKQAESEVRQRVEELRAANEELERFNRVAVDRELRMVELKQEVNEFCRKAGLPPRYSAGEEKT